jgi:hypothetical protein
VETFIVNRVDEYPGEQKFIEMTINVVEAIPCPGNQVADDSNTCSCPSSLPNWEEANELCVPEYEPVVVDVSASSMIYVKHTMFAMERVTLRETKATDADDYFWTKPNVD